MRSILVLGLAGAVVALGQQVAAEKREAIARAMVKDEPIVERAEFAAYLDPLVERVASHVPDSPADWAWKALVTRRESAEPRLLPDGTILLPLKILAKVRNEAEMSALIAHGVAHHALLFLRTHGDGPLVMFSGDLVPAAMAAELAGKERKADADTVAALAAAGYDSSAWRGLAVRLNLNREVGEGVPGGVPDSAAFEAFRAEIDAITAVKAPTLRRPGESPVRRW
ncbi:hypothetical protein F183_A48820 [Bryobacterales bacterium F-183]|nr:hypothetical protein F183_A48820 [Bryobacterales bacterium F-183]